MRRRLAPALAVLFLGLGVLACESLDADLAALGFQTAPLAQSPDPNVQAAGATNEVLDKERQAQDLLDRALETGDPSYVGDAIRLRPADPSLRFYQSAFLTAYSNPSEAIRATREGMGLLYRNYAPVDRIKALPLVMIQAMDAYLLTRQSFEAGSPEWQRLTELYCSFRKLAAEERLLSSFALSLYAAEGCP